MIKSNGQVVHYESKMLSSWDVYQYVDWHIIVLKANENDWTLAKFERFSVRFWKMLEK